MAIAKQLYQLQEVDLEIESGERSLGQMVSQLGDNQAVTGAQAGLASAQRHLDELTHRQRTAEWEIDDLVSKLTAIEEQLYGGRIKNPKELTDLQHEVDLMKAKREKMENNVLEIMGQAELAEDSVSTATGDLKKLEVEWHNQQEHLSTDVAALKSKLSALKQKRQQRSVEIDPQTAEVYDKLRKQKGQAVAKVEQGICRGCRISLPVSELQRVRSGNLMQCGSCGRILFLP